MKLWFLLIVTSPFVTLASTQLCESLYNVEEETDEKTSLTLSFRIPEDFLSWKLDIEFREEVTNIQTNFRKERLNSRKWRVSSSRHGGKISKGDIFILDFVSYHSTPSAGKPMELSMNDLVLCSGRCSSQYSVLQTDDSGWDAEYSFPVPETSSTFTVDFKFSRPVIKVMVLSVGSPRDTRVDDTTWRIQHNNLTLYKDWNIHARMWVAFSEPGPPISISSVICNEKTICENENCEKVVSIKRFDDSGWAAKISYPASFSASSTNTEVLFSRPLTSIKTMTPGVSFKNIDNTWKRFSYEQENRAVIEGDLVELELWIRNRNPGPITTIQSIRFQGEDVCQLGCGIVDKLAVGFIANGDNVESGEFPWHGAIYHQRGQRLGYACGATLIKPSVAITAAHCVTIKDSRTELRALDIQLIFGNTVNTFRQTSVSQLLGVKKIHVHAEYHPQEFKADIAIIILESSTKYTDYVRPVCLAYKQIETGSFGTVLGFGINENETLSSQLQKASLPVVSSEDCLENHPSHKENIANTFCAGFRNETNVCQGDSGSGMVFKSGSNWYLGGIVSHGIKDDEAAKCNPEYYSVFTDVNKYRRWINDIVSVN